MAHLCKDTNLIIQRQPSIIWALSYACAKCDFLSKHLMQKQFLIFWIQNSFDSMSRISQVRENVIYKNYYLIIFRLSSRIHHLSIVFYFIIIATKALFGYMGLETQQIYRQKFRVLQNDNNERLQSRKSDKFPRSSGGEFANICREPKHVSSHKNRRRKSLSTIWKDRR